MNYNHKISSLGLILFITTIIVIFLTGKTAEYLQITLQLIYFIFAVIFIFSEKHTKPLEYRLGYDKVIPVYSSFHNYLKAFAYIELFCVGFSLSVIISPFFGGIATYKEISTYIGFNEKNHIPLYTIWAINMYLCLTATLTYSLYKRMTEKSN